MKPKTKTLPAIRITDETFSNVAQALNKLNEETIVEITLQDFRRVCYEFVSQEILLGKTIKLQRQKQ